MTETRARTLSSPNQERKAAVQALKQLFLMSNMAYITVIQQYGVSPEDAAAQISRFDKPTRKRMWEHIQTVMLIDKDFAIEISPYVQAISWLFEEE